MDDIGSRTPVADVPTNNEPKMRPVLEQPTVIPHLPN